MEETQKFVGWMTGVNPDDYCPECGTLLHDTMTFSDGSKKMYAHEINSAKCKEIQEQNIDLFGNEAGL